MSYSMVDYTCAGCGAEAEVTSADGRMYGTRVVMVPHRPACPIGARVAGLRAKAKAARDAQPDGKE